MTFSPRDGAAGPRARRSRVLDARDPAVDGRRGGGARASSRREPVVVVRRRAAAPTASRSPSRPRGCCAGPRPAVMGADLEHGSLHEALARGGHHLRRGTATIAAAAATHEDARLLGIRRGRPAARRAARDLRRPRPPDRGDREPLPGRPVRARRAVRGRGRDARRGASRDVGASSRAGWCSPTRVVPGRRHDRGRLDRGGRARRGRRGGGRGPFIAPGFVDVHVHGWGGHDAHRRRERPDRDGPGAAAPGRDLVPADGAVAPRGRAAAVRRARARLDARRARRRRRSRWASTSRARSSRRRARAPTTRRSCARPTALGRRRPSSRCSTACG